ACLRGLSLKEMQDASTALSSCCSVFALPALKFARKERAVGVSVASSNKLTEELFRDVASKLRSSCRLLPCLPRLIPETEFDQPLRLFKNISSAQELASLQRPGLLFLPYQSDKSIATHVSLCHN